MTRINLSQFCFFLAEAPTVKGHPDKLGAFSVHKSELHILVQWGQEDYQDLTPQAQG